MPDQATQSECDRPRLATMIADLHVHTALSPCGGEEMTPPAIVAKAVERGLDMIAICDHNTAGNTAAVQEAAGDALAVLAGMEITTVEEAHVVGLFPTARAAEAAGDEIRSLLPEGDEDYTVFFGEQWLLASDGRRIGDETRALALATPLHLDAAVGLIKRHGGLAVAAHVDRKSFGVIAHLGLFPAEAGFDAIDVSRHLPDDAPLLDELTTYGLPLTSSSDSHYLAELGAATTTLTAAAPTFLELESAFRGREGRRAERTPHGRGAGPAQTMIRRGPDDRGRRARGGRRA